MRGVTVIGLIVSLGIECIQMAFGLGTFEFDDLIHNMLGAGIGFLIAERMRKHLIVKLNLRLMVII